MADITPSFDFGKNEIPSMAKLTQQALSLQISGLTFSDFASGIVSIFAGADSGVTGSSLVLGTPTGQLWIDAVGNVWLKEASGDVALYRYHTGWESRRFWVQEGSAYGDISPCPPGGVGIQTQLVADKENTDRMEGDTVNPDSIVCDILSTTTQDSQQARKHGLISETGVSGFRRWCGRGQHVFYNLDIGSNTTWSYDRDVKNNVRLVYGFGAPGVTQWFHTYYTNVATFNQSRFDGYVTSPMDGTSSSTDANFPTNGFRSRVQMMGYNYGIPKFGNAERGGLNP